MFGRGREQALSVREQREHLVAGVASNPGVLRVFALYRYVFYYTVPEEEKKKTQRLAFLMSAAVQWQDADTRLY